jgi:glycerol-3-phosphate dehydrogenase
MAEDAVNIAAKTTNLPQRPSATADLHLHGWTEAAAATQAASTNHDLSIYGSDRPAIDALTAASPNLASLLAPELPYTLAEVTWAARHEMARTVDDVLARRTRALFLNARAAIAAAPAAAAILATELGHDPTWQQQQVDTFRQLAEGYLYRS